MKNKIMKVVKYLSLTVLFFLFIAIFSAFDSEFSSDYEENTLKLNEFAPVFFFIETKLDYPKDARLLHISERKWMANFATNMIFSVADINIFIEQASKLYTFNKSIIDYPILDGKEMGESNGKILRIPFCENEWKGSDFEGEMDISLIKDICGTHEALFVQVDEQTEEGVVLVILPKQGVIWLNSTYWF